MAAMVGGSGARARARWLPLRGRGARRVVSRGMSARPKPQSKKVGWAPSFMDPMPSRSKIREYIKGSEGPPRVMSPLPPPKRNANSEFVLRRPQDLPLMLILPGIDGTGYTAAAQFPALSEKFDLRTFLIPVGDRSTVQELVDILVRSIEDELRHSPADRPVYVLGESFGGILALLVADACGPMAVNRVVLVNPATSFPESIWSTDAAISLLTSIPPEAYEFLPFALSPMLGNPLRLIAENKTKRNGNGSATATDAGRNGESRSERGQNGLSSVPDQFLGFGARLLKLLPIIESLRDVLPQETLEWKLSLLNDGAKMAEEVLPTVQQRVLVIAGTQDNLIPSEKEAKRLQKTMQVCSIQMVDGAGHALMQEQNVCVSEIMEEAGFYAPKLLLTSPSKSPKKGTDRLASGSSSAAAARKSQDDPKVLELPTKQELHLVCEDLGIVRMKQLISPVFFSTDAKGQVQSGLDAFPDTARPLVIVANHQTMALDLGFLISGLLEHKGVLARGLAHPTVFTPQNDQATYIKRVFSNFGAVPVTARNMFKLLRNGEIILLFPGGAREALRDRNEEYTLFWPDESEFVRIAAKFNGTILPLSGVGIDDSVDMLASTRELMDLPIISDVLKSISNDYQPVRSGEPPLIFPLTRPNIPKRLYFKFGKPVPLSSSMVKDQAACDQVYKEVRADVEGGISYLLEKRERDPYKDLLSRLLYERNASKQAPTFSV